MCEGARRLHGTRIWINRLVIVEEEDHKMILTLLAITSDIVLGNIDDAGCVWGWQFSIVMASVVEELLEEFVGIFLLY